MDIFSMKKSDFKSVPKRDWRDPAIEFTSLVIIPTKHIHDSGYRCMKYCACKNGEPIAIFNSGSDVMHLDGIGGRGERDISPEANRKIWKIDCLPCGYLHIWCVGYNFIASDGLSDFELFVKNK